MDGINGVEVKVAELKEDSVDDLKKDSPYQVASAFSPSVDVLPRTNYPCPASPSRTAPLQFSHTQR